MKKIRITMLCLLLALMASACGKEKRETPPEDLSGKLVLYDMAQPEGQLPQGSIEETLSRSEAEKIWTFLQGISREKWTDDNLCDRIAFMIDGEIQLSDRWPKVYFSTSSNVIYYDHFFTTIDVGQMQYIKGLDPRHIVDAAGPSSKVAYAGYTSWPYIERMVQTGDSLTDYKAADESHRRLPLFRLESVSELTGFMLRYSDVFNLTCSYSEIPSFADATKSYTEDFFKEHALMIAYVPTDSGSYRYGLKHVDYDKQSFSMYIEQVNRPIFCDDDMSGWFVLLEVNKKDIAHCTTFDALL